MYFGFFIAVHEYVTKTCGEKKSFNHFTKTDRRCQETTIGKHYTTIFLPMSRQHSYLLVSLN